MADWGNIVALVSLAGTLVTAFVTLKKLPGQQRLDQGQYDSLVVQTSKEVVEIVRGELADCREGRVQDRREFRRALEDKEREIEELRLWCRRLEAALREAHIPLPEAY